MLKRMMMIILSVLLCVSLLGGCKKNEDEKKESPDSEVDVLHLDDDEDEEDAPSGKEDEKTEKEDEDGETADENTYALRLKAPVSVFKDAGYDYEIALTIWENGTYTIVEEKEDAEGNVWGKLKSGSGWIDLTKIEEEDANPSPARAGLFDESAKLEDFQEVVIDDSEFSQKIVLIANETLTDLHITSLLPEIDGYTEDGVLGSVDKVTADKPLVLSVVFSGDFTTFGLDFKGEDGSVKHYAIYISGRNGELVFEEYEPLS